jgi:hypothetical protein
MEHERTVAMHEVPALRSWLVTKSHRAGYLLVGMALGAGLLAGFTFAHAAIGDSGKISACVDYSTGILRVAAKDGSCKSGEAPLAWSIQGPQGPQGVPGVF